MILNHYDYQNLHAMVFQPDYPGYKPRVFEAPNGDGRLDTGKRYAHVSQKYVHPHYATQQYLRCVYDQAFYEACRVADELKVPLSYWPERAHSALRVLEYPFGAGSEQHTDFDLFTILCYRNGPGLVRDDPTVETLDAVSPELHIGELGELCGLGPATPHRVEPRYDGEVQKSVVFFAVPDYFAPLPSGQTVGDWMAERKSRSRYG